ncbi:MAG: hypothetical protein DIU72_007860 [Pseudomonadota bacterium]|nr:MAG: hypothetical protein DIU72_02445 [Pseudomonadota bacterium]
MARRGIWGLVFLLGCAGVPGRPDGPTEVDPKNRYVSFDYGFEIERPSESWEFSEGKKAPQGIAIPVTLIHTATGSQVVVQVAPDVAPVEEFAVRLARGLGDNYGFITTEPVRIAPNRMQFTFTVEDRVEGKVGLRREPGRIFVVLGTWPKGVPRRVVSEIETIMESLRPVLVLEGAYATAGRG